VPTIPKPGNRGKPDRAFACYHAAEVLAKEIPFMSNSDRYRVPPEQLRWTLDPETLGFTGTDEVAPSPLTPGQQRAVRALEIGLGLRSRGHNVFLAGEAGTHRTETLDQLLTRLDHGDYAAEDFCYVHNFRQADHPRLLRFPGGRGCEFQSAMAEAMARLREGIPRLLGGEVYAKRRKARVKRYSARMEQIAAPLRGKAEPAGLSLVQVQVGEHSDAELLPIIDEEPVAFEDLEALVEKDEFPKSELQRLIETRRQLDADLRSFSEAADKLAAEAGNDLAGLEREMTRPHLNLVLSVVYQRFQDVEGVTEYLREVEAFLEERIEIFRQNEGDGESEAEEIRDVYRQLSVNLILDNKDRTERPIVHEPNPSVANLRGVIDREIRPGGRIVSDFTHIRAGALLRAHGGFLIVHADDLESEGQAAWNLIKRTLRTGQLRIEHEGGDHPSAPQAQRPQPIPVDLKVIFIGTPELYQVLLEADADFSKLFKIKAEFDSEMELSPQSLNDYAQLIRGVCDRDGLPPFSAGAVAATVEYGVRLAGRRNRITTQFSRIEDLVREAAFWAREKNGSPIGASAVHRAIDEGRNRLNLYEERTQRLIREGVLYIDIEGSAVGQINGLTVLDLGNHRFGRPARITATVGVGGAGIINIERQSELSGSFHDKGLLILNGFLRGTFAADYPLAMSASITLEQSYSEVDGDSATLSEALTLLSALADLPLRQDLAVTGSLNQKGAVQPIGGINEKIEGFFDICTARGLTGTQGVVVPESNLPNLMLRPRVVEAVREDRFHVYGVRRIDQAVELFTGIPAGARDETGAYPADSVFGRVEDRLRRLAGAVRDFLPWREGGA